MQCRSEEMMHCKRIPVLGDPGQQRLEPALGALAVGIQEGRAWAPAAETRTAPGAPSGTLRAVAGLVISGVRPGY
ncbi:hypothetical protein V5799_005681 [Amblyomma americanum]|uniref:Uncharacterized protein n=1 Tax=Amblyomma americanum TaxID=6943 RepID=A0AAQ4DYJ8_AMBAM